MSGHMVLMVWSSDGEIHGGNVFDRNECSEAPVCCPAVEHGRCGEECGQAAGLHWFACYSAPGYMDRTDSVSTREGPITAARECFGLYGDDEPGSDDRRELAQFIRQCRAQGYRK